MGAKYCLRFFFDPCGEPCLWAGNDAARERYGYPVEAGDLPLGPDTLSWLRSLAARYATSIDWADPGGPSPWTDADWGRFSVEVAAFLPRLRADIGPEFEVVDESARQLAGG